MKESKHLTLQFEMKRAKNRLIVAVAVLLILFQSVSCLEKWEVIVAVFVTCGKIFLKILSDTYFKSVLPYFMFF